MSNQLIQNYCTNPNSSSVNNNSTPSSRPAEFNDSTIYRDKINRRAISHNCCTYN